MARMIRGIARPVFGMEPGTRIFMIMRMIRPIMSWDVTGYPAQGSTGWRGAVTDLGNSFETDFTFADNTTNSLFFQFFLPAGSNIYDCMFGLADSVGSIDNTDSWRDFSAMLVQTIRCRFLIICRTTTLGMGSGHWLKEQTV